MLRLTFACVFCVGVSASLALAASAPVQVAFEDLPQLVQAKNQNVEGARQLLEAQESRTGYLLRSYLPTLRAEGGAEAFHSDPLGSNTEPFAGVEAKLNLYRGGRDSLEESIRNDKVQVSNAERQQTYFSELTRARKSYWSIVFQKEVVQIFKEALDLNEKNRAAAEKRIRAGIATDTDRIEFEINRVQLEQDLARQQLALSNAQGDLSVSLALPADTQFKTPSSIPHQHDDRLLGLQPDFGTHRDVVQLSATSAAFEDQKRQSYRWWTPSLDLFGAYLLFTEREREYPLIKDRYESVLGVRLSLELFDGLQAQADGKSSSFQSAAFESLAAQRRRELEVQLQTARAELILTHDLLHAGEKHLELGKQYFSQTLAEYSRGVKNSPDVLGATQKYVEYKRRYAELRRDYHLARADLLAVIGQ